MRFRFSPIFRLCSLAWVGLLFLSPLFAEDDVSFYPERLDDKNAVYLTPGEFGVKGDGIHDDTAAVQKAINAVVERTTLGILFVPEGKYRISGTIYIWQGIRVIGYGAHRPVFILGKESPGFYGGDPKCMFYFAGNIPGHPKHNGFTFLTQGSTSEEIDSGNSKHEDFAVHPFLEKATQEIDFGKVKDANPGTFYSALSNVDFEIESGNPAAACVRAHYAQHCFLTHIDFHLGSGLAGICNGGNYGEDLHFYGGHFGIMTLMPSPGWQFCLVDTTFQGQSEAAIRTEHAGLTLIRPQFKDEPTAVSIDSGESEQLWIKDGQMDGVTGPAVIISDERSARTQINMENVVCRGVPVFASFRESGKTVSGSGDIYRVEIFSHGLQLHDDGSLHPAETLSTITPLPNLPAKITTDITRLPDEKTWVNVKTLGVRGDGLHDDTAALRKALAAHRTLYFPCGAYRLTDTLELKPDTVLIGLHPSATRFFLADKTKAFAGLGEPVPMLLAPSGGTNIVTGLGVYTNGINPRAAGVKWMAGPGSLMNDVRFLGGHGTSQLNGASVEVYNNNHTADPDSDRIWDSQYPSLWITHGGGGTFTNIWTPNTFAQAGLVISDTETPGHIYELSSEHHVRNEIKLERASHWDLFDLQTEEERGESGFTLPIEIDGCADITLANCFFYRVVSHNQPGPAAVQVSDSHDIRFRNFHCFSDSKVSFDNVIVDSDNGLEIRQREFASFTLTGQKAPVPAASASTLLDATGVTKLPGTFNRAAGGAVDATGNLYFVDARWQRIYEWSVETQKLSLLSDAPLQPVNLACDKAGDLLVVSYLGAIYSLQPDTSKQPVDAKLPVLKPLPAKDQTALDAVVPRNWWLNNKDFTEDILLKRPWQYIAPDNSTYIPAEDEFVTGKLYYGSKMHELLRSFGLQTVAPGQTFYVTDENGEKTYAATLDAQGTINTLKLFANQGGESVATDSQGRVYIAAGQIFVYNPAGELIETIPVPERPLDLVFGGKDRKTLFIMAGTSVYQARIPGA